MDVNEREASQVAAKVAEISAVLAAKRKGPAQAASAAIECMVAAASPLVGAMFNGGTMQERLLFSLVLAGACSTMGDAGNNFSLEVTVSPDTIREAIDIYSRLTGNDIKPHLPHQMVNFAARALN